MKTGFERTEAALIILRETLRRVADWKVTKINGYALKAGKNGEALYHSTGGKILPKDIQIKILDRLLNSILRSDIDLGLSTIVKGSTRTLPSVVSVESSRARVLDAVNGILESTAKAGLMCALVDGVIGSVEAWYLVSKGRINKKEALRHSIKEATGGAISGAAGIAAVGMLTAISPIPVIGRMAVLTGVSVGIKGLWDKLRV